MAFAPDGRLRKDARRGLRGSTVGGDGRRAGVTVVHGRVGGVGGQGKAWNWRRQSVARRAPQRRPDVSVDFFYLPYAVVSSARPAASSTCFAGNFTRRVHIRKFARAGRSSPANREHSFRAVGLYRLYLPFARRASRSVSAAAIHSAFGTLGAYAFASRHAGRGFSGGSDKTAAIIPSDGTGSDGDMLGHTRDRQRRRPTRPASIKCLARSPLPRRRNLRLMIRLMISRVC